MNEVLTVRRTHDHSGLHEVLVRRVPPRSIYPGRRRMSKKDASRSLGDFTGNTVAEVGSKKGGAYSRDQRQLGVVELWSVRGGS